jgi:hypothetical protein
MKLIERTNSNNFQSYSTFSEDNEVLVKKLITLNLLSRLFNFIKNKISESEFNNGFNKDCSLKIIKLNSDSGKLLVGNLTTSPDSGNTVLNEKSLSDKQYSIFTDQGINLPSKEVLNSRLREVNYSDEDPFRNKIRKI